MPRCLAGAVGDVVLPCGRCVVAQVLSKDLQKEVFRLFAIKDGKWDINQQRLHRGESLSLRWRDV